MKIKRKGRRRPARRPGRLNIILDEDLKQWAHDYADAHHTTLTSLITAYLVHLKIKENVIDVEQI
jgi:hypothetical protein